jgi:hypothetical protein
LSHLSSLTYSTITVLYILDGLASKKLERPKKLSLVYNLPEKSIMVLNNELKRVCKKGINKTMEVFISETIALIKIKKEVGGRSKL